MNKLKIKAYDINNKALISLLAVFLLIGNCLLPALYSKAQDPENIITVDDFSNLKSAINAQTQDTVIYLSNQINTTLTGEITLTGLSVNSNIIIDGCQLSGELTAAVGKRHLAISNTGSGTITFKNMSFKGFRTPSQILAQETGTSAGGIDLSQGKYMLDNLFLHAIFGNAVTGGGNKTIVNCTFQDNIATNGAAINAGGILQVAYSTFENNYGNGGGWSGGAICFNGNIAKIRNSVFLNNQTSLRGGAFASHLAQNGAEIEIDSCYFEKNTNNVTNTYQVSAHDGGAVSIFGQSGTSVKFKLTNSTFYDNYSIDDGGAVFIENWFTNASNYIANCTIIGNKADNQSASIETGGGAIQTSLETPCTMENNTIVANFTKSSTGAGAGIGFHNDSSLAKKPITTLKNNIILGNYGTGTNGTSANVGASLYGTVIDSGGNIKIDNGTKLPVNVDLLHVFGSDAPKLADNNSKVMSGNPNDSAAGHYRIIPALAILPNDGMDVFGLADNSAVLSGLTSDQRNFDRNLSTSDVGALESVWAKFDSNGGTWLSLPDLSYDGTQYYTKNDQGETKLIYKMTYIDGEVSYPLEPVFDDHIFSGWNTEPDGSGDFYQSADVLTIPSDLVLYAQWDPVAAPTEEVTETPVITPTEAVTETPVVAPTEAVTETPAVTPTEAVTETPAVTPTETVTETPVVTPTETVIETPVVTPTETVTATPVITPTEAVTETPVVTSTEAVTVTPVVTPTGTVTETPVITPTEAVIESPTETVTETPVVTPTETVTATPIHTDPTNFIPTAKPTGIYVKDSWKDPDHPVTGDHTTTVAISIIIACIGVMAVIEWKRKKMI